MRLMAYFGYHNLYLLTRIAAISTEIDDYLTNFLVKVFFPKAKDGVVA